MHERNAHRAGYDFAALTRALPELARHVRLNPNGGETIDFADPAAVLALNRALLRHHYGVTEWEVPAGFLCPPIPSRADYLHYLADLLAWISAWARTACIQRSVSPSMAGASWARRWM
jgi:23S rRNA (adenine1618-N6)-methyltransferase